MATRPEDSMGWSMVRHGMRGDRARIWPDLPLRIMTTSTTQPDQNDLVRVS